MYKIKSKDAFSLDSINDGLVAVLVAQPDSKFSQKQLSLFDSAKAALQEKAIEVLFVSSADVTVDVEFENYILDENRELINKADFLKAKDNLKTEYLIFYKKLGTSWTYLVHKESPEVQYDWSKVVQDFAVNYATSEPDEKGLYKWGQLAPETADYLCVDCGYIVTFQEGDVFPVCEVCLSGEPAGPASSDAGYWEKI